MRICFIGGGNMATAMISGISKAAQATEWIHVSEPNPQARERLEAAYPVKCFESAVQAASNADAIILAVKPQIMPIVLRELGGAVSPGQLIISIAAGITIATIQRSLGEAPVIRVMPNTPALIGKGISGMYATPGCSNRDRGIAEQLLSATGESIWVEEENLIDVVTAVSGSGPAYYFLLTEALREAGETLGLKAEAASSLAIHTAHGAGAMAFGSDVDIAELRKRVTSPGGTTQAALESFESDDFKKVVLRAVKAAASRADELSRDGEHS